MCEAEDVPKTEAAIAVPADETTVYVPTDAEDPIDNGDPACAGVFNSVVVDD